MIVFRCTSCQKKLSVKDELAGKKVHCPGCKAVTLVASLTAVSSNAESSQAASVIAEQDQPSAAPAPSLADCATAPPSSRADNTTPPNPVPQHDASLTDFLAPAQGDDELGRLGGFRILKILGHGGMGVVFQGEDPKLGRKVAIKAMLPHLARSASSQQRFLGEARAAAALEHDNIVAIHHVGEDRGAPFIVMPYLKGEPLDRRLQRDEKPSIAEILRLGREIARGLAAAHAQGLIHRDIKPANIWLEAPESRVKILDFGLARAAATDSGLTQEGAIIGTPAYMAPEQGRGEKVDARCDLWSLGVVLYRMCAGRAPFQGSDIVSTLVSVATENPPPPAKVNPNLPAGLSDLVMKLLEKDADKRISSAEAVMEALRDLEQAGPATQAIAETKTSSLHDRGKKADVTFTWADQETTDRSPPAGRSRKMLLLALAGVVAAALVVLGIVMFRPGPRESGKDDSGLMDGGNNGSGSEDKSGKPADGSSGGFVPQQIVNSLGMKFALVGKGKFRSGGGEGKAGEKELEIPYDYWLGVYEVTQEEWEKVMEVNPSFFSRSGGGKLGLKSIPDDELKRFPVDRVSWTDCQAFVHRLNEQVKTKESGWVYRLPTEAEWEYACRGGPLAKSEDAGLDFCLDVPSSTLPPEKANFNKVQKGTHKVGFSPPNPLGLYDMHGNVAEWCHETVIDAKRGALWVNRGGGWDDDPVLCRAAGRNVGLPSRRGNNNGLRLARVPAGTAVTADIDRRPMINLLSLIDPGKDAVLGKWTPNGNEWWTDRNEVALAEFPYRPPNEYDFRIEFTCRAGVGQIKQFLARQDRSFSYILGAENNSLFGLEMIGGKAVSDNNPTTLSRRLSPNERHMCIVHVRNECVTVVLDGKEVARWKTDYSDLSLDDPKEKKWTRRDRSLLAVGSAATETSFTKAEVVEITGRSVLTRPDDLPSRKAAAQRDAPAKYFNRLGMEFVLVGRGALKVGQGKGRDKQIAIPHDFYMGVYEVTQEDWEKVMGSNPSRFTHHPKNKGRYAVNDIPEGELKRFPVDSVSWNDSQDFLKALNAKVKESGWVYRLPKEAEWEYACRGGRLATKAGAGFEFYLDRPANTLSMTKANFKGTDKGLKRPCRVGSYPPNRLGLFDMHGNLAEWCEDSQGNMRVVRGGSWDSTSTDCQAGARATRSPMMRLSTFGLRLVRVFVGVEKK